MTDSLSTFSREKQTFFLWQQCLPAAEGRTKAGRVSRRLSNVIQNSCFHIQIATAIKLEAENVQVMVWQEEQYSCYHKIQFVVSKTHYIIL